MQSVLFAVEPLSGEKGARIDSRVNFVPEFRFLVCTYAGTLNLSAETAYVQYTPYQRTYANEHLVWPSAETQKIAFWQNLLV